jgi:hypothetical protein
MAALEQKAAEIHYTAVEGLDKGTLIADIEQTTWDAAETLAWLGERTHTDKVTIPHRDADAMVPDRAGFVGAAFWYLDDGDLARCSEYDSVMMRRAIAEGKDLYGQHFISTEEIPKFALRLATATVDYIWTVQGRSANQRVKSAS